MRGYADQAQRRLEIDADLFAEAYLDDPYALYATLRRQSRIWWSRHQSAWIVTRYGDVRSLLKDHRIDHWSTEGPGALARWLQMMSPSSQSRLRALCLSVFSSARLGLLRRDVEELAMSLLSATRPSGGMDAISGYAEPLALAVMCRVLGIPPERQNECGRLVRAYSNAIFTAPNATHGSTAHALFAFISALVAKRGNRSCSADLLDAIIQARVEGDPIDEPEVTAFLAFFMFAAFENSCNFIGNAVLALSRHPLQFERLRAYPALVPQAVEELLRYDSPVQFMMVGSNAPIEIEQTIGVGDRVLLGIGSANHDPDRFSDPDQLDVGRTDCAHVTFGFGPMTCVGSAFARLEAQIAIAALASGCSGIALAGTPERRLGLPVLRGLQSLPVVLRS